MGHLTSGGFCELSSWPRPNHFCTHSEHPGVCRGCQSVFLCIHPEVAGGTISQTPGCSECVQKWFGCGQELHSQNPPEVKWPIVQEAIQNSRSTPPLYQANSGWMDKIGGSQEIKSTLTTEAFFMYWKAKARDSKLCRASENSTRTTTLTSTPGRKSLNASAVLAGLIAAFPKWFL